MAQRMVAGVSRQAFLTNPLSKGCMGGAIPHGSVPASVPILAVSRKRRRRADARGAFHSELGGVWPGGRTDRPSAGAGASPPGPFANRAVGCSGRYRRRLDLLGARRRAGQAILVGGRRLAWLAGLNPWRGHCPLALFGVAAQPAALVEALVMLRAARDVDGFSPAPREDRGYVA